MVRISIETPDQPEILALLRASDAYMGELYPAESNHLLDVKSLLDPRVTFVVARIQGEAAGCGAFVRYADGAAEIKRMFVSPAARGRRLGRRLLEELEMLAGESGATVLRLETGIKQPEALELYRSAGFAERGPFGDYLPDPLSVFMEKAIGARPSITSVKR